jgi:AcrR family transcriptional regulator
VTSAAATAVRKGTRPSRRDVLLESAARCFAAKGYEAASTRAIAEGAGMQAASLYSHFRSKSDLLVGVHEVGMRRIRSAVEAVLEQERSAWDRLEAACVAHLTALLGGDIFFAAVMRNVPPRSDPAYERIRAMRDDYECLFVELIADLDLPPNADRRKLRLMLLGSMSWSFTWFSPDRDSPEDIARAFVGFLRQSLDREGCG